MPNWLGISAVALLGFVGGTSLSGCKPQDTAAARFPFAFVQKGCGPTDGIAIEFYFTTKQSRGGKYTEPYLYIQLSENLQNPAPQNYSIKQRSSDLLAGRCLKSGRCDDAISGFLQLTRFGVPQGASGKYELHFLDGSVETGDFDAQWYNVKNLACG